MTYNKQSDHLTSSSIQNDENNQIVIGADVIAYLSGLKYPMIMVDRIINYSQLSLIAERYVSANEHAFVGHFPNLKLWPGIYTLEGLRQACCLLHIIRKLEEADLLKGLLELQNRQTFRPQINHEICQRVIDYLKNNRIVDSDIYSIRTKLLEPVFAGSLIKYHCSRDNNNCHLFFVNAMVNERMIAQGEITQIFN